MFGMPHYLMFQVDIVGKGRLRLALVDKKHDDVLDCVCLTTDEVLNGDLRKHVEDFRESLIAANVYSVED